MKRKSFRLNKKSTDKKRLNPMWLIVVVGLGFVAATIFLTIQTTASGAEIAYLDEEINKLERENKEYVHQLERAISISDLSEKADSLGFMKPSEIIYTQRQEPFAKLP